MQLHQLIDKCIEWVALDGVLGTEPLALHQHLRKFDASLDDAYFAYLYTVLVEHPSIRVSLANHPLAAPDKTVRLGEAPLPDDYEMPDVVRKDVDISAMYLNGIKGRALAFHLAGEDFKSNAQAVEDRRESHKFNASLKNNAIARKELKEKKKVSQTNLEEELIRNLDVDDGGGIAKEDLNALAQRWGSRLRLRCIDEEIYYRLTGMHQKNPKITPIVFQTLQLAAKSREKGITAIELGPLVGSSQGSMHHYMKVLTTLGLCAKIPTVIHAATTNLLVFHAFLQENDNYKATRQGGLISETQAQVSGPLEAEDADDPGIAQGPATASDWGLTFTELSEEQLMNGYIVKERLTKLLDHPSLTNHLLRAKNLLPLLGWKAVAGLRHRRAVPRAIRAMIESGQVEYVDIGDKRVRCIRLTKYDPDRMARTKPAAVRPNISGLHDVGQLVTKYTPPLVVPGGVTSLQSIPYQIDERIQLSGAEGMRIIDLRDSLFGLFRRMIEFHFTRLEKMTSAPIHLQHWRVTTVMESWGRERRLRAFGVTAYRDLLKENNEPIDNKVHPPVPREAGHFADVSYRAYCSDQKAYNWHLDKIGTPSQGATILDIPRAKVLTKGPRNPTPDESDSPQQAAPSPPEATQPKPSRTLTSHIKPSKAKAPRYGQESQVRGRPRKYIHVVTPDGTVERLIIGSVLPHPDLAPIWLYLPLLDKLVPANPGYSGLGPAPEPTDNEMKLAKTPEWFSRYARQKGTKPPAVNRRQLLAKEARSANPAKRKSPPPITVIDDEDQPEGSSWRSKRPRKTVDRPLEQDIEQIIGEHEGSTLPASHAEEADIIAIDDPSKDGQDGRPPVIEPPHSPGQSEDEFDHVHVMMDIPTTEQPPFAHTDMMDGVDPSSADADPAPAASPSGAVSISESYLDPKLDFAKTTSTPLAQRVSANLEHQPVNHGGPSQARKVPSGLSVLEQPTPAERANSQTPPLRNRSPSPVIRHERSVPYTPSQHHPQDPPQQYYTPPGIQSYTILPPVVYVPPGYTVWPPLPPGYPTTDVPPPQHQAGPVSGAMPGYWNHAAQHQPRSPYGSQSPMPANRHPPRGHPPPTRPHSQDMRPPSSSGPSGLAPRHGTPVAQPGSSRPHTVPTQARLPASRTPTSESRPVSRVQSREEIRQPRSSTPIELSVTPSSRMESQRSDSQAPSPNHQARESHAMDVDVFTHTAEGSSSPLNEQVSTPAETENPPPPPPVRLPLPARIAKAATPQPAPPSLNAHAPLPEAAAPDQPSTAPFELIPIRAPKNVKKGRMDIGAVRRANEMLTVLQETGGVCEEHELWRLHQVWSFKVAGTDAPHAPSKGATMDRSVWKRLIISTKDDGRTDNTQSSVPTSTAAWRTYRVMWLVDTPQDRVQQYMRGLAHTIKKATAPKEIPSTKVPHMLYTEVKLPPFHPSSTNQRQLAEDVDQECRDLSGDERRNALCKDPLVLSQLYGRQNGKWARTNLFHCAVRSTVEAPSCTSVLDRSAGVFLAPLMSQDIPIGTFFAVVMTHDRDDELLKWLETPANRRVPVRDVPFNVRTTHDQRRQRTQTRIRAHVDLLLALGLLSPLTPTTADDAYVVVNIAHMPNTPLKIDTKENMVDNRTTTYVLHDWAPLYHIAAVNPVLLGYMPVRNECEINAFWETYRLVCLESRVDKLPEFTPRASLTSRNIADLGDVLRISTSWSRTMRHPYRWQNELRLLPVQRDALNNAIDCTEAKSLIETPEQMQALAWEFAVPEDAVRKYLETRLAKAKDAKEKREKRDFEIHEAKKARHLRAQRALAVKLSVRQAQSKQAWEQRVAGICARLHVQYDPRLLDHVSRQSLTSMSKGSLTDDMIERIIRQYYSHRLIQSVKENLPPPSMPLQPLPPVRKRAPKELVKRDRPYRAPGTRYRRKWSAEDDELIVDGEAVIRARNRDRPPNFRNRVGLEKLFPGSSPVTLVSRLKKTITTPEKEHYVRLLADAWYDIWVRYRGTDELPDASFEDNHTLDLLAHIAFLRKHVNKTELSAHAKAIAGRIVAKQEVIAPELPDKLSKVFGEFRWQHLPTTRTSFEMLWQALNSQEVRMGQIGSLSLLQRDKTAGPPTVPSLARHRLRGILKMIIATEPSQYTQPAAVALLKDYDQTLTVNPEIVKMQHEKILVRHSSASSTGRFYTFGSAWEGLRHGPFSTDFFRDAAGLEDKISKPAAVEWPVLGSSGELASLMNMVSDQTVEFEFDTQNFPSVMAGGAIINTRRLYDQAFEFGFKTKKIPDQKISVEPPSIYYCPVPRRWEGDSESPKVDLAKLYVEVEKAGVDGISKADLSAALTMTRIELDSLLSTLSKAPHPKVFWAGYDTARLISNRSWPEWQCPARRIKFGEDGKIKPDGEGEVRCTPRIWVDIWGRRTEDKWEEAVGCARGWLLSRPGMTERIFRQKLGVVMDRLEINDVIQYLLDKGSAQRSWTDGRKGPVPPVEAVDVDEEDEIVWRPEPKRLLA